MSRPSRSSEDMLAQYLPADTVSMLDSAEGGISRMDSGASSIEDRTEGDPSTSGVPFVPLVRYGVADDRGSRQKMEDAHLCLDDIGYLLGTSSQPQSFFAVFDGHGGEDAAHYARDHILANILSSSKFPDHTAEALTQGFIRTDLEFDQACMSGDLDASGTTAIAIMLMGATMYIANAGDCRAVLSKRGKAVDLSEDHKPASKKELERIKAMGGYVEDGYLNGALGASRAIGDWHLQLKGEGGLKTTGPLSCEPDVEKVVLAHEDEFMIMACDGLWDVFTSQNAIAYARSQLRQHNDPAKCSQELVAEALRRHTTDNVSVITVCFTPDPPPKRVFSNTNSALGGLRRAMSGEALSALQTALNSG